MRVEVGVREREIRILKVPERTSRSMKGRQGDISLKMDGRTEGGGGLHCL